jgi:hypothetical protein
LVKLVEIELKNPSLSSFLDDFIARFNFGTDHHCESALFRNVTKDFATKRVSEESLNEIGGNRDVATNDCSLYKFNHFTQEQLDLHKLVTLISPVFPDNKVGISGRIWYPINGYMGWHTNGNAPGYRMYASWSEEGGKSFFRYKKDNEILTSYDKKGWNYRLFKVPFWHCVYSEINRISLGFVITNK